MQKHIVFIGGGPAGYVGAIRASQLGAHVTLIEKDAIGGTCLNRGCIPTKALFKNAEILHTLNHIDDFGITVDTVSIDFARIMQRKDEVVDQLVSGIEKLLVDYKVEVLRGTAAFLDASTLQVELPDETLTLKADAFIVATGSVPTIPDIPGHDLPGVITSDELLEMTELPASLAIAGSGVIGAEFASIFNALGSDVTMISSTLLKRVDGEIQKRLPSILKRQGLTVIKDSRVQSIRKDGELLEILSTDKKKGKETITRAQYLLMATGRRAFHDTLNLEAAGVSFTQKGITVDERFRTNVPTIYAVGDVIGGMMLAHVASREAIDAVEMILGKTPQTNYQIVPDCVFIHPEVSYVGMTEEAVQAQGLDYLTSKFQFAANGKSLSMGNREGFIKVIAEATTHRILGVHIMGPHASDLIHEAALALNHQMDVHDIAKVIHAHPTLAEAFAESTEGLVDMAVHLSPKKRK